MSVIHYPSGVHSASRPNQPPSHVGASPASSGVSDAAVDALLKSGPNDAREPKQPDVSKAAPASIATLQRNLSELAPQIDKRLVERTLREPACKRSNAVVDKLCALLTSENIDSLLNSSDGKANAKTLGQIETQLNNDAVGSAITPLEAELIDAYRRHVDSELFNLKYSLMSAPISSRFNMIRSFANKKAESLSDIEDHLAAAGTRATLLCTIAERVKNKLGALKFAENSFQNNPRTFDPDVDTARTHCPSQSHVFRYNAINESSMTTPSEIRHFAQGRDKLDVTGIRHHLDKPLQWVNRLSGASGEMLLKYSPATQTSVLVISGDKGAPAFVAKIFGEVRESDVLT